MRQGPEFESGRIFFFFKRELFRFKKIVSLFFCLLVLCRLNFHIVEMFFFWLYTIYIVVDFSVLIYFCCL